MTLFGDYNIFVTNCSKLFDIIGDSYRIKGQELLWRVKMTDTGTSIKICLVLQIGYCSNVDKKWEKTEIGKQKTEEKEKS